MKEEFRLLLVTEPGRDGVFLIVRDVARQIHDHHPEITVDLAYSSVRGGQSLTDCVAAIEANGGVTVDLGIGNAPQLGDFAAAGKIMRLVREREYDIIHCHSSKAGALVRLLSLQPRFPPVLYSPHAYFGMPRQGGKKEFFFNTIEGLLGHLAQTHNCSEDERDFAQHALHLTPSSLHVVHNGIDLTRFHPVSAAEKAALRASLGLRIDGRLLVTAGRDSYQKNYPELYKALGTVLPTSDWHFAHAGAGSVELRATLPPDAATHCTAISFLEEPARLYQAADAFILPSRYEGLSLAMLEALSCGLAMILTEAPGLRGLKQLDLPDIQWLPDPAKDPDTARHICQVLETWQLPSPAALDRQHHIAEDHFNTLKQTEKLVRLYAEIVTGPSMS